MCFSAEASFATGAALLPVGAYCVWRAARNEPRFLPLALVPIAFGLQQVAEGFVWLGLHHGDPVLVSRSAVVFLFFALPFWPLWLPLSLLPPEGRRPARVFLAALVLVSPVWLWLYAPLATDPGRWLSTEVVHHSIAYQFSSLPAFQLAPRALWRVAYLASICGPLLVASPGSGGGLLRAVGGGVVAALFVVTYLIYWYAFTSVWCFFAALLSLLLALAFARLPPRAPDAGAGRPASCPERLHA
jgi:hypothetical protein